MELRDAVLTLVKQGFDVISKEVSEVTLSSFEGQGDHFLVEVYDPIEKETGKPLDPTWEKSSLYKLMGRVGNFSQRAFTSPVEAVDFYLALIEEVKDIPI